MRETGAYHVQIIERERSSRRGEFSQYTEALISPRIRPVELDEPLEHLASRLYLVRETLKRALFSIEVKGERKETYGRRIPLTPEGDRKLFNEAGIIVEYLYSM